MGILYPLIMHDKYFDITLTKYKAFEVALCIYAVLMALAVLLDIFDGRRPFDMFKSKKWIYCGRLVHGWILGIQSGSIRTFGR